MNALFQTVISEQTYNIIDIDSTQNNMMLEFIEAFCDRTRDLDNTDDYNQISTDLKYMRALIRVNGTDQSVNHKVDEIFLHMRQVQNYIC